MFTYLISVIVVEYKGDFMNSWKKTLKMNVFLVNPETGDKDLLFTKMTDPVSFFENFPVGRKNMLITQEPNSTDRMLVIREVDESKPKYMLAEVSDTIGFDYSPHHPLAHIIRSIYS